MIPQVVRYILLIARSYAEAVYAIAVITDGGYEQRAFLSLKAMIAGTGRQRPKHDAIDAIHVQSGEEAFGSYSLDVIYPI